MVFFNRKVMLVIKFVVRVNFKLDFEKIEINFFVFIYDYIE